jgi:PTS system beta-glucosides-specific IIC component
MALGAFLRLQEKDEKAAQLGYFLSGAVGGVTEPALYGCGFKFTRSLAGMIIGGLVGGAVAGILGVKVYVLGSASVLGVVGFMQGGTFNLVAGIASSVLALVVAAAVTYFFGFTKEQLEEDRKAAGLAE